MRHGLAYDDGPVEARARREMKRCSAEETAALLRRRETMSLGFGPAQPCALLEAISQREDWRDLTVFAGLLLEPYPVFTKPGVHLLSGFFGPAERALRDAGHEDFTSGGSFEADDRSLIGLPSTVEVAGEIRSRIHSVFGAGTVVTTPRHQIDAVVTEFGVAEVLGLTVRHRAHALQDSRCATGSRARAQANFDRAAPGRTTMNSMPSSPTTKPYSCPAASAAESRASSVRSMPSVESRQPPESTMKSSSWL
jgi:hypothetical protein